MATAHKHLGQAMRRARCHYAAKLYDTARGIGIRSTELSAMESGFKRATDAALDYYASVFRMNGKEARKLRETGDA